MGTVRGYVIDFFFNNPAVVFFILFFLRTLNTLSGKKIYIFAEMTTGKPIIGGGFPNNQENPTKDLN